jgi:hypothetical protein
MLVLVMIACSFAYTWWQRSARTVIPGERIETAHAAKSAEAPATPPEPTPTPAETPATAPAGETTQPVAVTPAQDATATETAAPASSPQNAPGTANPDAPQGALHIALTAEEPTWVRATANGKVVFTGTIQTNETKDLSAADTMTLRIGNAGGISINLNGKVIPAVGPKGQVRVVQLSPDGAVQVTQPPKPPQAPEQPTQTL